MALDFVPKPVSEERFKKAINKVNDNKFPGMRAKYLPIRKPNRITLVELKEVSYFRGDGNNVEIRLRGGGSEYHRQTLDSLAKVLSPQFSRIHRSYIVDLAEIKCVKYRSGGLYEAELNGGGKVPVSRHYYKNFKNVIFEKPAAAPADSWQEITQS
jgi:two-component system, LytTR family, response regulator LytT